MKAAFFSKLLPIIIAIGSGRGYAGWRSAEKKDKVASPMDRKPDIIDVVPKLPQLADSHGRTFEYLRLSITDICNFSCTYCLPNGYQKPKLPQTFLSVEEIERVVRGFAALGLWKVRLTGGEPTLRDDFTDIAKAVASVPGVRHLAMTTNGYRLAERAQSYAEAGIRAVNISIDSLKPEQFRNITGHDRLAGILEGVEACRDVGIESIKINAVLLKGLNDTELDDFIAFVETRDVALRFIEVMRTNDNAAFFAERHLSGQTVMDRLKHLGWQPVARSAGAGPAVEYAHPQARGRIGVIAPYADHFCDSCNRLRVSATGKMHLCLFGDGGLDLRLYLNHDEQHDELVAYIQSMMGAKLPAHRLHAGNSGATPHLASIGG